MQYNNIIDVIISVGKFMTSSWRLIFDYAVTHFSLVITALFFSILLWFSIGLIISKYERLSAPVFALANIIFCIPGISLFGLFVTIPWLGLGRKSAALALVLYAMMPMVRGVYRGIKSVDMNVIDAGRGMGMSGYQILTGIQIPMAWPVMFAGLRVTVVLVTGMATMATFIGESNLGRLIHHGITRGNADMIIGGAVVVSVIALILDFIMGTLEKKLTSPGLV